MEQQDYRTTFELEDHNWWFVGMRRISLDLLVGGGHALPAGPMLDVGCGTGIMLSDLETLAPATGLDFSSTALEFCRERGATRLIQGRGEALPFGDQTFAAVTGFGVVEHIEADAQAVNEWARVLKPGGRLVLLTSAYQWMWSGHDVSNHHFRRYLASDIEKLLNASGLADIRVSYANTLLFPPIAALRLAERLKNGKRPPKARKDTGEVPAFANRALLGMLGLEQRLLRHRRLPFGVSIVATATKPQV